MLERKGFRLNSIFQTMPAFILFIYECQKYAKEIIIFKDFKFQRLGEILTFILAKGKTT